jgi:hypothetical protein
LDAVGRALVEVADREIEDAVLVAHADRLRNEVTPEDGEPQRAFGATHG